MEIVIGAAVIAIGIVVAAALFSPRRAAPVTAGAGAPGPGGAVATMPSAPAAVADDEEDPERVDRIDRQSDELARREQELAAREERAKADRASVEEERNRLQRELERIAGLSGAQAKQILLKEVEDQARHDAARLVRQVEEETKRDADRRVRNILSVCMQRIAAGHAAETTVTVVQLTSDDMKGRIIGREG